MSATPTQSQTSGEARAWILLPAAVMAAETAALIFTANDVGSWENDQTRHHLVAIEQFVAQWPSPDLVNYPSATSPGWHLLLAMLVKLGAGVTALRCVSALAGIALLLVATAAAARWVSPRTAAFLLLPLALSPYAVGGSAWITTDVPALACVAIALAAATATVFRPWTAGVAAAVGVAIRQPVAWLAVPIFLRAMRERSVAGTVAALLPLAVVATFVLMWKGLMPPLYRDIHNSGVNLAAIPLLLALSACWAGPIALALLASEWREHPQSAKRTIVGACGLALVVAAAVACMETSLSREAGRWGGPIWQLAGRAPEFQGRSFVMLTLAPLGAAALWVMIRGAMQRGMRAQAGLLLVALVFVAASNAANSQAWERYADLPLLLLLPWLAALAVANRRAASGVELAALFVALMQVGIAAITVWKPAYTAGAAP